MIGFIKKLLAHELISGSFYIFLGNFVANITAFLLNLFFARKLSYSDYAIFASLLSVITLASIPALSLNNIIIKFAAHHFVKEEKDKLKQLYFMFFKFTFLLSFAVVILFAIFSLPLMNYLKLDNYWYIIITGFTVAAFYISTFNTAFLQSFLKFKYISAVSITGGLIKLITGVILVIVGFRAFSGIWSIFFMMMGMFILAFPPLLKFLKEKTETQKINLDINTIISYSFPAFITLFFMTSFTSTDVILVKHFFNPHLAGFYAGLSLIGKVIFYFTAPIPIVMFPLLVKRHAKGVSFNNLFYLSLALVLIPSFAITVFYFINPKFVINLFLGGRDYLYVQNYLGIFGIYLTIFSMVNVCVNFFLSLNKTIVMIPVVASAVMQIIFIYFFHQDFAQVIWVSILTSALLLLTLLGMYFKSYGNIKKINLPVSFLRIPFN